MVHKSGSMRGARSDPSPYSTIACIENPDVVATILEHIRVREAATTTNPRAPPINTELPAVRYQDRLLWETTAWRQAATATPVTTVSRGLSVSGVHRRIFNGLNRRL